MDALIKNLRYGVRTLLRKPTFTLVAVLSLAFGIGANTTIFSIVNELFLQPLPVEEPSRLVAIYTHDAKNPGSVPVSHLNWKDIRDDHQVFSGVTGYDWTAMSVAAGEGEAKFVIGQMVAGNYFDLLGDQAVQGRTIRPEETESPLNQPVAILNHGFWTTQLGADEAIVGSKILINNHPFTVVGVAPEGFNGTDAGVRPEIWVPMMMNPVIRPDTNWYESRRGLFIFTLARLAPGVQLDAAQARLEVLGQRLASDYPDDNQGRSFKLLPMSQANINPGLRQILAASTTMLMVVVGLVLLIACANVANLLLTRAAERRKEIAIRLSIGASRKQLIQQLLSESLLISILGGAAGLLVAFWARNALLTVLPSLPFPVTISAQFALDFKVLFFTFALALLTGLIFGLLPAIQASRPELMASIKDQTDPALGETRKLTWRNVLVIAQVALSLVALCGAGLFLRSLEEAQQTDPGFESEKLVSVNFNVGLQGYDQPQGEQFFRDVKSRVESLPGIAQATLGQAGPLQPSLMRSVFLENQHDQNDRTLIQVNVVALDYFSTMGIDFVSGRDFSEIDHATSVPTVVVNETLAGTFFPDQDPLGQRFTFFGDEQPVEVIGVVKDSKYNGLGEDPQPYAYQPLAQRYIGGVTLIARTEGKASPTLAAVQKELRQMDPKMPLVGASTVGDLLFDALWGPRVGAALLTIFGLLALTIAGIGLYGVMSYSVSRRTREIGIRMALGAQRSGVMRMILTHGMLLVGAGLLLGFVVTFLVSRLIAGMLYVSPTDPIALISTGAVLTLVALAASFFPAQRATGVDPIEVLRHE